MKWYHCYFDNGKMVPVYGQSLAGAAYYAELWCPRQKIVLIVPLDESGKEVR